VTYESLDSEVDQVTQRQIWILRGIVEGKTNHELATEVGFSVSTIRKHAQTLNVGFTLADPVD
jgi:DNA-binding NarL/FixJ family response regulator